MVCPFPTSVTCKQSKSFGTFFRIAHNNKVEGKSLFGNCNAKKPKATLKKKNKTANWNKKDVLRTSIESIVSHAF